jgi:hypothetical protein
LAQLDSESCLPNDSVVVLSLRESSAVAMGGIPPLLIDPGVPLLAPYLPIPMLLEREDAPLPSPLPGTRAGSG